MWGEEKTGQQRYQAGSRMGHAHTKNGEQACKHAELISYKVHKDQFKSLLVPKKADLPIKQGDRSTKMKKDKMFDMLREKQRKLGSNVSDSGLSKISAEKHTASSEMGSEPDIDENNLTDSGDECMSTEGEESDPNSPLIPDKQYLNQSNDLRQALIESKALVGDYIELKNCKRCGSMIFKVSWSKGL